MDENQLQQIIGETQTNLEGLMGDNLGEKGEERPKIQRARRRKSEAEVEVGSGLDRFSEPIPAHETNETPQKQLYEIIDNWQGWRILVRGAWHLITYIQAPAPEDDAVGVATKVVVDTYPKDTPVLR